MGARISVQFQNEDDKSVVLFNHWGGIEFRDTARDYVRDLRQAVKTNGGVSPLDRMEVNTVMVDFIRHITKDVDRVEDSLYLAKDENEGDNSDYGHHIIDL